MHAYLYRIVHVQRGGDKPSRASKWRNISWKYNAPLLYFSHLKVMAGLDQNLFVVGEDPIFTRCL